MISRICAAMLLLVGLGVAQGPMPFTAPMWHGEFPGFNTMHRPMAWWKNPELAQKIGITDAQVQKLDQIVQDHRLKTIDLRAALEREQVRLEPMIHAANPDENQILAQIDKVSVQRAQLEKANVQMMLAIHRVLTPEQLKKLQSSMNVRYEVHRTFRGEHGPDGGPFFKQHFEAHPDVAPGGPQQDKPQPPQGGEPPSE